MSCSALVDTGSSATLVRPNMVGNNTAISHKLFKLQTVAGEQAPMVGEALAVLAAESITTETACWASPHSLPAPLPVLPAASLHPHPVPATPLTAAPAANLHPLQAHGTLLSAPPTPDPLQAPATLSALPCWHSHTTGPCHTTRHGAESLSCEVGLAEKL